ncbi:MAG TPA: YlxR family protein [Anaerolineaceae bacterium]|jgi:predicted RNA-binding protein YlxR (DUF448 family)|nr:YlxR family protein [Anaerolineaceae bacterium]HPT23336.1 YlxR family protein [Anaerolineaceae bacterium]
MALKGVRKPRHVPQRTCVGCRQVLPKRNLIRIVRVEDGARMDPTGKLAGRGAYLHDLRSCWDKALKGPLANALRTTIPQADLETLKDYAKSLPAGDPVLQDNGTEGSGEQEELLTD